MYQYLMMMNKIMIMIQTINIFAHLNAVLNHLKPKIN